MTLKEREDNNESHDRDAQKALERLWSCGKEFDTLKRYIYEMLDDVFISEKYDTTSDVLSAWTNGIYQASEQQRITIEMLKQTVNFMEEDSFSRLDSYKKAEYWDTVMTLKKNTIRLGVQYQFYCMLSEIAHSEQTISLLWQQIKIQKNTLLYRVLNGTLARRWLTHHRRTLTNTRQRLTYEIEHLLKLIECAIDHTQFGTMSPEKQQEYHTKWKWHKQSMTEIYID